MECTSLVIIDDILSDFAYNRKLELVWAYVKTFQGQTLKVQKTITMHGPTKNQNKDSRVTSVQIFGQ